MKLNKMGWELWKIWYENYHHENDKLGGNSADGYFVDGWCIIDNTDYIKNITDQCGLLIFGYDDNAVDIVTEWLETWGNETIFGYDFTWLDVKTELLKYFE